jgi:hypothetical protein
MVAMVMPVEVTAVMRAGAAMAEAEVAAVEAVAGVVAINGRLPDAVTS